MTGATSHGPSGDGWDALAAEVRGCVACQELAASRTQVVPGAPAETGPGDLVLVGEAPGADEDAAGLPFVGRSGQLLDRLLVEAGTSREAVTVLNVLKCRPPGNRAPRAAEVARCRPWLRAQLGLSRPRVVVTLGSSATAWFLGRGARLTELRGSAVPWLGEQLDAGSGDASEAGSPGGRGARSPDGSPDGSAQATADPIWVWPTYHPSAALRFGPRAVPMAALREDLAAAVAHWRRLTEAST